MLYATYVAFGFLNGINGVKRIDALAKYVAFKQEIQLPTAQRCSSRLAQLVF
jgi:hypothetical protein